MQASFYNNFIITTSSYVQMKFTYRVAQNKNIYTVFAPDHKNVKL
jgi:hypothetical protein